MNKVIKNINVLLITSLMAFPLFSCKTDELTSQKESLEEELEFQKTEYENLMNSVIEKNSEEISNLNKEYKDKISSLEEENQKLKDEINYILSSNFFDTTKMTEITFYHTMNSELKTILDHSIDRFNDIYPNIIVTNVSAGDYEGVEDQLVTSIAAGKAICDVTYCYPDHVAVYKSSNIIMPLDSYIKSANFGLSLDQISDFIPEYWNEGKSFGDNHMYTLPFSKSTDLMFYNKTFFEKEGLKVPTHWFPTTEDINDDKTSMEYICKYIKNKYPDKYPLVYDSSSNWFINLCEQYNSPYLSATAEHYLFDNEVNRNFVSKIKGWYQNDYATTSHIYAEDNFSPFKNLNDSFMCISSSTNAKKMNPEGKDFEVGVANLPQVDIHNGRAISQGPNLCIIKNKDPQKNMASWLLLKYLTTDIQLQTELSIASGCNPTIKSAYENNIYKEFLNKADGREKINGLSILKAKEQEKWLFTSPSFIGSIDARKKIGKLLDTAMKGTLSVEHAFQEAIKELQSN